MLGKKFHRFAQEWEKLCYTKSTSEKGQLHSHFLGKKSWTVKSALSHSVSDKFHMLSLDDPELYIIIIIIIITLSCLGLIYINQLLQLQKTAEIKLPKL